MFWKRKMTIKPQVLAQILFTELIQRKHCDWHPAKPGAVERLGNELWVRSSTVPALDAKIRLYQFTCILLAVINAAQTKPNFIPVREHLERLFFPPTPQQGVDVLLHVRGAIADISELLSTQQGQQHATPSTKGGASMFWAHNWLSTVGVEESNPVTLSLFALNWMDYYITASNSLNDFNPVA